MANMGCSPHETAIDSHHRGYSGASAGRRLRAQKVTFPLIVSKGPKVHVTNEKIYEQIEFP